MLLEIYKDEYGKEPFSEWLSSIKDIRILARRDKNHE